MTEEQLERAAYAAFFIQKNARSPELRSIIQVKEFFKIHGNGER